MCSFAAAINNLFLNRITKVKNNNMRTKFYFFITGLLLSVCATSFGQEIVSEFSLQNGKLYSNTDIMECSDGTLLTGIAYYSNDYNENGLLVCKTSPEGQLIDSMAFDYGTLFSINGATDRFVISSFRLEDADSTEFFQMTFLDANLNITETVSIPIFSGVDPQRLAIDELILTPEDDFIVSYWTDLVNHSYWTKAGVFHMMRIRLDGTIVAESETDRMLSPNWSNGHPTDSSLTYYSQGFGILEESPRVYYKIGGYIGTNSNHPWPLIAYSFDENLVLTDTILYKYLDESTYFDWVGHEHFVPFEKNTSKTYLMAAQIHHPDGVYKASMVKYDTENNPLIIKSVETSTTTGSPIKTIVIDENTVYHAYQIHQGYYNTSVGLVRLDNGLNNLWGITLSGGQSNYAYGQCLKSLQNGDIAIAFFTSYGNSGDNFHLYIIHDSYDNTLEMMGGKKPFTLNPNPVKDQVNLVFDEDAKPARLDLFDLEGGMVGTKHSKLESYDMSALPSGVYMLSVTMKNGTTYFEKVIKN